MLPPILRMVRVAAVLTIVVALSGHKIVRPAVAGGGDVKCENAEGTWCAGIGFYEDAQCTGTVEPCTTCWRSSGTCAGHGGFKAGDEM
jgi:hypothetical protein